MSDKEKLKKNVIVGFIGQLITMVFGLIVPRIMLVNYGSDINGLTSTVTQIFTYMALLEAGIGQASKNILFKYFAKNDRDNISKTASVARSYYRKITLIYGAAVIALSFLLPIAIKSDVDYWTIFLVTFFQGMAGVVSFYFIENQTMVLTADGRSYFINGVETINKIISYIVRIVLASMQFNIAFVQFTYFIITILKAVVYTRYFKKNYGWIKFDKPNKGEKLADRNAYILTEVAWTIFSSTDMIVLSMFVSTKLSSVYSIYNMVFTAINALVNAIFTSINYELGLTFHQDLNKYKKIHYLYMSVFVGLMTVLMSTTYMVIIPFVKLYTKGVSDINYIYTSLPVMFCLVQILSWSRYIQGNLTGVAGYAKPTSIISVIEAAINLSMSILLVQHFGVAGVLFATVIALPLKVIFTTYISDHVVFHSSYRRTISILGINYLFFAGVVSLGHFIKLEIGSYLSFLVYGAVIFIVCAVIGAFLNTLVNRDCLLVFKKIIKR